VREPTRDRPWQLLLTGKDIGQIDAATRQALEQILELFAEVPGLMVHTVAGKVSVTRDFPSDYTTQVDRLLRAIFKNNRCVTGIEFLGLETPHTVTLDDPYWPDFKKRKFTYDSGSAQCTKSGACVARSAAYRIENV
jgi:hypothetical protein